MNSFQQISPRMSVKWSCLRKITKRRTYSNKPKLAGQRERRDVVTRRGDDAIPTRYGDDRGRPVHSHRSVTLCDNASALAAGRVPVGCFRHHYPRVRFLPSHEVWPCSGPRTLLAPSSHWDALQSSSGHGHSKVWLGVITRSLQSKR